LNYKIEEALFMKKITAALISLVTLAGLSVQADVIADYTLENIVTLKIMRT